jgi:hypothetical protein
MSLVVSILHDARLGLLDQVFWFSSCSWIKWKGEIEWLLGIERLSILLKFDGIVNDFI